ncbi:MAG: hypothetical protein ABSG68_01960 [Thermoguttaceae bacterium]|jgi:hypothetical protein
MVRIDKIGLDDLGEPPSDAEAAPTDAWFIGQIPAECTIRVVKGMSGGPIYGFRRNDKGRLTYHVVALQSQIKGLRRFSLAGAFRTFLRFAPSCRQFRFGCRSLGWGNLVSLHVCVLNVFITECGSQIILKEIALALGGFHGLD